MGKQPKSNLRPVLVRFPPGQLARLDRFCQRTGCERSWTIRAAVDAYLETVGGSEKQGVNGGEEEGGIGGGSTEAEDSRTERDGSQTDPEGEEAQGGRARRRRHPA